MALKNVITTINADVKKQNAYMDNVQVVKHDSIRFIINMLDGGKPLTDGQMGQVETATLVNLRRDGVPVPVLGEIIGGNQLVFDIGRKVTDVLGGVRAMAQLYDVDGHRISSLSFNYTVVADLSGGNPPVLGEEQTLIEVVLGDGPLVIEQAIAASEYANLAGNVAGEEADRAKVEADYIQARRPQIEKSITDASVAKEKSEQADAKSDHAIDVSERVREEFDRVIAETGDSIPEITQARGGKVNLNERLNEFTSQLAEKATKDEVAEKVSKVDLENFLPEYAVNGIKAVDISVAQKTGYNKLTFGFITDSHGYYDHMKAVKELAKYGQMDFVVHGGDMNTTEQGIEAVRSEFAKGSRILKEIEQPVFCIQGNHDSDTASSFTTSEWFNRLVKPFRQNDIVVNPLEPEQGYYYQDFNRHKVRVLFLNSSSIPNTPTTPKSSTFYRWGLSPLQLQWVANIALDFRSKDADKDNWSVLVFGHHNTRQNFTLSPPVTNGEVLEQILKAFKNGTSYSHIETGIDIDFISQGGLPVIAYIFGHSHYDAMQIPSDLGFPLISTASSKPDYYANPPTDNFSYPRPINTLNEDAWDVFTIDVVNKLINIKRYGAGIDRFLSYKYVVVDTFSRENSASGGIGFADTGQEWIQQSGKFAVLGNKAVKSEGGTGGGFDQTVIDSGKSNVMLNTIVTWKTANSGGLTLRNSDNSNFIQAVISVSGLILSKYVNGVSTTIGSYGFTPIDNQSYQLKVTADGDSIIVLLDGVERISVTEVFNSTASQHGLRAPSGLSLQFDNFTVEVI